MLLLFPKCRSYMFLGAAVAVALFSFLVMKDFSLAACLVLIFGLFASRFFAEFMALKQHQKILSILYYGKDPETFASVYESLIADKKLVDNVRFTMQSHLVNAYIASGSFDRALESLDHMPPLASVNQAYGNSLIAGNRCLIYCMQDDLEQAEKYYDEFISYGESITRKQSRISYIESKTVLTIRIKMLKGTCSKQDAYDLRERLKAQITPFQKAELQYLLGRVYLVLKDTHLAQNSLKEAASAGDKLYAARRAKALL
ncbi:MAG: hypothetical protein ACI39W_00080 [Brotaphodocola sp.]